MPSWPGPERGEQAGKLEAPAAGLEEAGEEGPSPHWQPSAVLRGVHTSSPQGCFVCYGRKKGFNHDHRTCPVHKADTEAYKKAHGSKKRAPAGIREAKMEVDKDELAKLMSSVGTELAKEIQEIKRNWVPRSDNKNKENNQNDQNKDKDKKGKGGGKGGRKKGINDVEAEENTPSSTTDAP